MVTVEKNNLDSQRYRRMYETSVEPWNYNHRGAEILRHKEIAQFLAEVQPKYDAGLDIGCSLGQLTQKLAPLCGQLFAFDVSLAAVQKARSRCQSPHIRFLLAELPGLPFAGEKFDLIVAADAIHEFVPEVKREMAIGEIFSALKKNGYALFTDYMKSEYFPNFVTMIQKNRFRIVRILPLYDRCWYQFESWFKAVRHWDGIKKILASTAIAQGLKWPAKLMGSQGSRHILILAQKPED